MRVLFLKWPSLTSADLEEALSRLDIPFDRLEIEGDKGEVPDEIVFTNVKESLQNPGYDAVLSINYYHIVAEACHDIGIPYLAWTYDSPLREARRENLHYETNWVFFFDGRECRSLKQRGEGTHLFHLPLAVNTRRYDSVYLSSRERKKYGSDISFIGQLYNNPIFYLLSELPDYEREYLTALMKVQLGTYGLVVIRPSLTDELL